jgi:hypothetical protein
MHFHKKLGFFHKLDNLILKKSILILLAQNFSLQNEVAINLKF